MSKSVITAARREQVSSFELQRLDMIADDEWCTIDHKLAMAFGVATQSDRPNTYKVDGFRLTADAMMMYAAGQWPGSERLEQATIQLTQQHNFLEHQGDLIYTPRAGGFIDLRAAFWGAGKTLAALLSDTPRHCIEPKHDEIAALMPRAAKRWVETWDQTIELI